MVNIRLRERKLWFHTNIIKFINKILWYKIKIGFKCKPTILNIFTTNRCNFSCFYCSRNVRDSVPGLESRRYDYHSDFQYNDLEFLLGKYPSIQKVSFVGIGEPFLNKDLLTMAEFAKSMQKVVGVITNGSLLHRYRKKIGPRFDEISISLHGLSAEELKNISCVEHAVFHQLIDNIKYLVQEECRSYPSLDVRASVVVLKNNLNRVRQAVEFCVKNSLPVIDLQNYLPYSLTDYENCLFDDDSPYINFLQSLKQEFDGKIKINLPPLIKRRDNDVAWDCLSFFNTLRVDGLSQVSGCARMLVPQRENGNFRLESDVWHNKYFQEMRGRFGRRQDLPKCCRYCPEAQ